MRFENIKDFDDNVQGTVSNLVLAGETCVDQIFSHLIADTLTPNLPLEPFQNAISKLDEELKSQGDSDKPEQADANLLG